VHRVDSKINANYELYKCTFYNCVSNLRVLAIKMLTRLSTICEVIPTVNCLAITSERNKIRNYHTVYQKYSRFNAQVAQEKSCSFAILWLEMCNKFQEPYIIRSFMCNIQHDITQILNYTRWFGRARNKSISLTINLIFSKLALSDGLIKKRFITYYSSFVETEERTKTVPAAI